MYYKTETQKTCFPSTTSNDEDQIL